MRFVREARDTDARPVDAHVELRPRRRGPSARRDHAECLGSPIRDLERGLAGDQFDRAGRSSRSERDAGARVHLDRDAVHHGHLALLADAGTIISAQFEQRRPQIERRVHHHDPGCRGRQRTSDDRTAAGDRRPAAGGRAAARRPRIREQALARGAERLPEPAGLRKSRRMRRALAAPAPQGRRVGRPRLSGRQTTNPGMGFALKRGKLVVMLVALNHQRCMLPVVLKPVVAMLCGRAGGPP
ncbi:hypothetical protein chiPu_0030480, partial [Chiloscyllium punctatum]|nr:hypothetical protein [Chiloscyllium punctatum]